MEARGRPFSKLTSLPARGMGTRSCVGPMAAVPATPGCATCAAMLLAPFCDLVEAFQAICAYALTNLELFFRYSPYALADRKSTRLNSSHVKISYAVFCL